LIFCINLNCPSMCSVQPLLPSPLSVLFLALFCGSHYCRTRGFGSLLQVFKTSDFFLPSRGLRFLHCSSSPPIPSDRDSISALRQDDVVPRASGNEKRPAPPRYPSLILPTARHFSQDVLVQIVPMSLCFYSSFNPHPPLFFFLKKRIRLPTFFPFLE